MGVQVATWCYIKEAPEKAHIKADVFCQKEVKKDDYWKNPNEIAKRIVQTRTPLGLFYIVENGIFVAIDNSDGNA